MYNTKLYCLSALLLIISLTACSVQKPSATTVNTATPPVHINEAAPKTNRNPAPANGLPIAPKIDPNYIKQK